MPKTRDILEFEVFGNSIANNFKINEDTNNGTGFYGDIVWMLSIWGFSTVERLEIVLKV